MSTPHWAATVFIASMVSAGVTGSDTELRVAVERARDRLGAFLDQRYIEFIHDTDPTGFQPFELEAIRAQGETLRAQLGRPCAIDTEYAQPGAETVLVRFRVLYERAAVWLNVVVDAQGRLNAFFQTQQPEPLEPWDPPAYVDRRLFEERPIVLRSNGFELAASLCLPQAPGRLPGLVLVAGMGPWDQDMTVGACKPFRDLAWGLATQGIVTLRYTTRSQAERMSVQAASMNVHEMMVDDAVAAIRRLRRNSRVRRNQVCVLLHGYAARIAPLLARRVPRLAGIVIVASPGRSVFDPLEREARWGERSIARTLIAQDAKPVFDQALETLRRVRSGEDVPGAAFKCLPLSFWRQLEQVNVFAAARDLRQQILVIGVGRSPLITREDFTDWRTALKDCEHVTFRWYPTLDLALVPRTQVSGPEACWQGGHVSQSLINDLVEWIRRIRPPPDR